MVNGKWWKNELLLSIYYLLFTIHYSPSFHFSLVNAFGPFGKLTSLMLRRCDFRLKSRERQLIVDSSPAVTNSPPQPNTIIMIFPVAVRLRPCDMDSMVRIPRQPSTA